MDKESIHQNVKLSVGMLLGIENVSCVPIHRYRNDSGADENNRKQDTTDSSHTANKSSNPYLSCRTHPERHNAPDVQAQRLVSIAEQLNFMAQVFGVVA